ncbi:MAG: hypothetical protein NTV34_22075 [Proteobacteria bacterium]|nr:hypothetical protein [Pseudomonadota bacterium]
MITEFALMVPMSAGVFLAQNSETASGRTYGGLMFVVLLGVLVLNMLGNSSGIEYSEPKGVTP